MDLYTPYARSDRTPFRTLLILILLACAALNCNHSPKTAEACGWEKHPEDPHLRPLSRPRVIVFEK